MSKKPLARPTEGELAILQVLWDRGPSTVRDVHEALRESRGTGYTTTLKLLQIMMEKGLVVRDDAKWSHVYQAAQPAAQTQRQLVRDLLDRVFHGSAEQLVLQALSAKRASKEELAEIRRVLDDLEKGIE
jgi:predicted transcriptional regulator